MFGAGAGCGWALKWVGLHGAGGSSTTWNSYHRRAEARGIVLSGFSDGASYALSLGLRNGDLFGGARSLH